MRKMPKFTKFELADDCNISALKPYVLRVLEAVGHPEALVTDESSVYDFFDTFDSKKKKMRSVLGLSKKLGIDVSDDDLIWEVARNLKDFDANVARSSCLE